MGYTIIGNCHLHGICGTGDIKKVMKGCVNIARCEHDCTWGGLLAYDSRRYTNM
jgi:hypothetical protein